MQGLESLRNLVDLDLSENHIEVIDGLENQKILKSLILYTNKIKKMENIFHLSNLQILSLSTTINNQGMNEL
jgi:protein phosphatase 1 regulatory subunit 7